MTMELMTVAEFATKHADQCGCGQDRVAHIQTHIDLMIEAAVAHERTLWRVVSDAEGRVSLIWDSHEAEYWNSHLVEAAQILILKKMLGMS